MRATRVTMWARAASVVPAATASGRWRRISRTCAAARRRMRLRLRMAAIEASRMRLALSGVGTACQSSISQGALIGLEVEEGREVAPELLAHAVGKADALAAEVFSDARPFAQFDDDRIGGGQAAEAVRIGAQGGGHDQAVAAVILGAGHRVAVAKAVHLLGIEDPDGEAALDQRLDHRPMRHLDGDVDLAGLGAAAGGQQPGRHLGQTLAGMLEDFLADVVALLVDEPHMVALACPVDTGIPTLSITHAVTPLQTASHRDPRRYLYWRSPCLRHERRGLPTGHRSRPIRRGTCPPQVIVSRGGVGCSRRTGSVLQITTFWAVARGTAGVPLRSTPPVPRRLPQDRLERVQVARRAGGGKPQSKRLQISDHGLQDHPWGLPPPPRMTRVQHFGICSGCRLHSPVIAGTSRWLTP